MALVGERVPARRQRLSGRSRSPETRPPARARVMARAGTAPAARLSAPVSRRRRRLRSSRRRPRPSRPRGARAWTVQPSEFRCAASSRIASRPPWSASASTTSRPASTVQSVCRHWSRYRARSSPPVSPGHARAGVNAFLALDDDDDGRRRVCASSVEPVQRPRRRHPPLDPAAAAGLGTARTAVSFCRPRRPRGSATPIELAALVSVVVAAHPRPCQELPPNPRRHRRHRLRLRWSRPDDLQPGAAVARRGRARAPP